MKPLGFNVLIKQDIPEKSPIILQNAIDPPTTGVVMDVGSTVTDLTSGDKVLFTNSYSSHLVPGYTTLLVMHQDSVLLIL